MFGILEQNLCKKANVVHSHHYNYCGTCKSIGSLYGNKSRLFLNNDIVFLSAILNDLSNKNRGCSIEKLDRSCFKLPKAGEVSSIFNFTSSLNVFLTKVKFNDSKEDNNGVKKMLVQGGELFYHNHFKKAYNVLQGMNFPLQKVEDHLNENTTLEATAHLTLEQYTDPTAKITRLCFEFGASLIHQSEAMIQKIGEIGSYLGQLVYLIDAKTDLKKDTEKNDFNPILKSDLITLDAVNTAIQNAQNQLCEVLENIHLTGALKNRYLRKIRNLNASDSGKIIKKKKLKKQGHHNQNQHYDEGYDENNCDCCLLDCLPDIPIGSNSCGSNKRGEGMKGSNHGDGHNEGESTGDTGNFGDGGDSNEGTYSGDSGGNSNENSGCGCDCGDCDCCDGCCCSNCCCGCDGCCCDCDCDC
ncbi:DUF5685 family protein [Flammeovirga sp. SJP92]|uniref:DUF5685 family protein n=1 Tax=Flammeovirga sp. SJP92 TaxID=1775430 RepID=UPI000794631D|nr:DUF5685 family protein [Flammeovirga sp. SJP92]KXX66508.1 hypothetical protein AVL50_31775 [Flammeovirga sp. SJP92]